MITQAMEDRVKWEGELASLREPAKRPSEWQYVRYWCGDCGHEGEIPVRLGEHVFCGNCGSQYVTRPKDKPAGQPGGSK